MSVQSKVAEVRTARPVAARESAAVPAEDGLDPSAMRDVLALLPGEGVTFVARAPRMLEVMGGSAAFMGSLVLTMPLAEQVIVAARPRHDGMLSISLAGAPDHNGDAPMQLPLAALNSASSAPFGESDFAHSDGHQTGVIRTVLAELARAVRSDPVLMRTGGLSISVAKPAHDEGAGSDFLGSVAAATLAVVAAATGAEPPSPIVGVGSGHPAERTPQGMITAADVACALHGKPDTLGVHRGETGVSEDPVVLPESVAVVGVDSGLWPDDRMAKQALYRTATFLGRYLVDRMLRHDGEAVDGWNGMLARIAVDDYVQRYRDRIPTKMQGRDFLERFGDLGAVAEIIDPTHVYKVRSRTEHPIYEHVRAVGFADALRRFARGGDAAVLSEAGELMYGSHWSYGQRCGLGSVETDLLVNLIRRQGEAAGVFGAKITGMGGGGVVCVLMNKTEQAEAALSEVVREYAARTNLRPRVLRGSSAGALACGVTRVSI